MKRLAILGSTGSIGRQTLEIVRAFPERFKVVALACEKNATLLRDQVAEFRPKFVYCKAFNHNDRIGAANFLPLQEIACHPDVDLLVVATSGKAGLVPTLAAIGCRKNIALANKEVLVMAGELVMARARQYEANIVPVDSEHSAIWQCLRGENRREISKLILTASGGPFRLLPLSELLTVTPGQALSHPTWQMGTKVTIDSATLTNKGMEIIEAHWLFDVPFSQIEVVIHPQSVIHSIVEFIDGSSKAQLSMPDMRIPIQYALSYPERWQGQQPSALDYVKLGSLKFEAVDYNRFPCLTLAREAGIKGGTYPAVLSAADEVAIELFLNKRIRFPDIPTLIAAALDGHRVTYHPSLEDIFAADEWAREMVTSRFQDRAWL